MTRSILICLILCALTPQCFAQGIPSGAILWLRADSGVVMQNRHVAIWKDQSGHGNDVHMTDTNSQPDFLAVDSNGKPSIVFRGSNYFEAPNIFPTWHDYTIAVVAKLTNSANLNNLVSGTYRALWLNGNLYPHVLHYSFDMQEIATVPMWSNAASSIVALYSFAYNQAQLFVNGEFADSSFVSTTTDSTLFIGSFNRGYFLQGEIQEVLLYDRELSATDRTSLDDYLRSRYGIAHGLPAPKPDSTFAKVPKHLQLYGRGTDDSASIPIVGTIFKPGFDSVYTILYKADMPLLRTATHLSYTEGRAPFEFSPRIHAELSEYRIEVHLKAGLFDSTIARADSLVCGDIFLIDGQSNAVYGYEVDTFRNEYCRTFGYHYSEDLRDTTWATAIAFKWGDYNSTGAWGQRIQRDILERDGIPTCCINGAQSATSISVHERDSINKYDLRAPYGRLLYRTTEAGLLNDVHAIIWDQGELNYATGYYQSFLQLSQSWKEDFPNLRKIYLFQNRPNYCGCCNIDLRDVQRAIPDSLHDVEAISTANIDGQDGCHFLDWGYNNRGDRLFLSFARDFYHATDTSDLRSPNAIYAYYTNPNHSQLAVLFSPRGVELHSTNDTVVTGKLQTLKDYLYTDDTNVHVQSISFNRDTLFVNLEGSAHATSIGYLPDQYYTGTDSIYEGPWIVNNRDIGALIWYHLPISNSPMTVNSQLGAEGSSELYPNPTSRIIKFDSGNLSLPIQARIVSEAGALVRTMRVTTLENKTLSIDLGGLHRGSYLIELTDHNKTITRKLVLEP